MLLILRALLALLTLCGFWIGGAQLGILLLGPDNDLIILFGSIGMFVGIAAALEILTPNV